MSNFEYLFGVMLGELILKHCDNLSKTLQIPSLTAVEGPEIAQLTQKNLESLQNEDSFDLFWSRLFPYKKS